MDRCTHEILSTTNDNLLQQTTLHKPDAEVVAAIQLNRGQGAVSSRLLAVLGYDKYHIGDAVYYGQVEYHIRIPLHLFDHTCFNLFSRCEVEVYIATKQQLSWPPSALWHIYIKCGWNLMHTLAKFMSIAALVWQQVFFSYVRGLRSSSAS